MGAAVPLRLRERVDGGRDVSGVWRCVEKATGYVARLIAM